MTKKAPRMRTTRQVYEDILAEDKNTSIKKYTIDKLVDNGIIGSVETENKGKRLVDYDEVLDYFNCRVIPPVNKNIATTECKETKIKHINRFKDFL